MEELEILIQSLTNQLKELRTAERVLLKASGLNEEIEKSKISVGEIEIALENKNKAHKELIEKKNKALSTTISKFGDAITRMLPFGEAVVIVDESNQLFIGLKFQNGNVVPYAGLSGGEKVAFDSGIANALGADVVIVEAAEMDNNNLLSYLERIANEAFQTIVNTCHPIGNVPEGWKVIDVKRERGDDVREK